MAYGENECMAFTLHFVPLFLNLLNKVLGGPPSIGDMVK